MEIRCGEVVESSSEVADAIRTGNVSVVIKLVGKGVKES